MPYILGIDNGLTVSKAVIFDKTGQTVAIARTQVPRLVPQAYHVERDMHALWIATAIAIGEAIEQAGCAASEIIAVAATAHGDGLYLVDEIGHPLRHGILSLDSRASEIVTRWEIDGTSAHALERTGQVPHASAPATLLKWVQQNEPSVFARIHKILACKDWLRFCLTNTLGTDLTEASTSFTDVKTQSYGDGILEIYGLQALAHALPEVSLPQEVVGKVTAEAAAATGLAEGTPVVAGLHDVTASALGIGGYGEGTVAIVAGTYSINETLSHVPKTDPKWFCRNGIKRGEWNNMSISPASAGNYDWFLENFMASDLAGLGDAIHAKIAREIEAVKDQPACVLFHPYLFGSPHGTTASSSFLGLRGWHGRGEVLRAIIEGIAFNHRVHIDALRSAFDVNGARLTGGISRNPTFCQIFADALDLPISVPKIEEAAAWGAALCAGVGSGTIEQFKPDTTCTNLDVELYIPNQSRAADMNDLFDLHCTASDALAPIWKKLEERAQSHLKGTQT